MILHIVTDCGILDHVPSQLLIRMNPVLSPCQYDGPLHRIFMEIAAITFSQLRHVQGSHPLNVLGWSGS